MFLAHFTARIHRIASNIHSIRSNRRAVDVSLGRRIDVVTPRRLDRARDDRVRELQAHVRENHHRCRVQTRRWMRRRTITG
jgi:hypothetical protein